MSAPDLAGVLAGVEEDMRDFVAGLQRHGPTYARRYAEFVTSSSAVGPKRPPELPAEVAAAIRESVLERSMVARMGAIEATPRRAARLRRLASDGARA